MSLWYDKNKKSYASNGHGSWVKLYAEHLFDVLKEEIFSKFAGHYSGNEGKHQADDVSYDSSLSVREKFDEIQQDITGKVDKSTGMGLSQNNYSNEEKSKLAGIEPGAEVNLVKSVAGKTGNVTLSKTDVGLDKIDNTADIDKPISKATQNILNLKQNKPSEIDLTEHNLTTEGLLTGDYLDNCFEGRYVIKYGITTIEDGMDYSQYNYARLEVTAENDNMLSRKTRYLQELTVSSAGNNPTRADKNYSTHKYTRLYSSFNGEFGWSEWKKDVAYQEIICNLNPLNETSLDNYFSIGGQVEKYILKETENSCIAGTLTIFRTGTNYDSSANDEAQFYTQILEVFKRPSDYSSDFAVSKFVRTYGKYIDNEYDIQTFVKGWSDWTPVGQNV